MTPRARLHRLLQHLQSGPIDPTKFDMASWATCAIGEAARLPELAADGLHIVEHAPNPSDPETTVSYTVTYNNLVNYYAIAAFFDISFCAAMECFHATAGPTAYQVYQSLCGYLSIESRVALV